MNEDFNIMLDLEKKANELIKELETLKKSSELYKTSQKELQDLQLSLKQFIDLFNKLNIAIKEGSESLNSNTKSLVNVKKDIDKINKVVQDTLKENSNVIIELDKNITENLEETTDYSKNINDQVALISKNLNEKIANINESLSGVNQKLSITMILIVIFGIIALIHK